MTGPNPGPAPRPRAGPGSGGEPGPGPAGPARSTERRRPASLATGILVVTIAVAVVTVLVAGVVSFGLVRSAAEQDARRSLATLADGGAAAVERGNRPLTGLLRLLARQRVDVGLVSPDGTVRGRDQLVQDALGPDEVRSILAGHDVSAARRVDGQRVLIEARVIPDGGLVLVQRHSDATDIGSSVGRRTLLALAIGLAVAVVAAVLLARRLARPLQRAAHAARMLAGGRRDVRVLPDGPAEVAEVADSLNTLAAALQYSESRQRRFLLSVSHELRTPLTAITGFAESLADGVTAGAEVPPVGAIMLGEARRLERLVSDLLDLARLGAQDFRIDLAEVDISELVRHAGDVWRARCDAEGVCFALEAPEHPVVVLTDATRIRQIVDGLAENALRVTPCGAPIVLALSATPGAVLVQVRDGGPGLTPQDCAVAFERSVLYERYRGVRQVGTGVGLALVHGLASRLGGTATAGRAPEGGASFTVRLPLSAFVEPDPVTVPLPHLSGIPSGSRGGGTRAWPPG
ncbi:MAG TPA: HAMP domain-containing sensor histidine kinase [Mycobacteriales bacterium]|nr:HAMP domain-containing sensor histidine kinase [Mycobacteriales bacterium]